MQHVAVRLGFVQTRNLTYCRSVSFVTGFGSRQTRITSIKPALINIRALTPIAPPAAQAPP